MGDASEFRQRFLDDIYPEIGQYMTNDMVRVLARNLNCTTHAVLSALPTSAIQNAARRIVQGTPKRSGEPYDQSFVKRVWRLTEPSWLCGIYSGRAFGLWPKSTMSSLWSWPKLRILVLQHNV